ncbi:hypothetical protein SB748_33675, partial [Rhizobium sp. SIMBA_035]
GKDIFDHIQHPLTGTGHDFQVPGYLCIRSVLGSRLTEFDVAENGGQGIAEVVADAACLPSQQGVAALRLGQRTGQFLRTVFQGESFN